MSWIDDLIVKLSGGTFTLANLMSLSAGSLVTEKDKFITAKGVTRVVQIKEMPYEFHRELITLINNMVTKVDSTVRVSSYIEAEGCKIPIAHPTFVSKANKALEKYVQTDQLYRGLGTIHQKSGVFRHNGVSMKSFGKEDVVAAKQTSESYTDVRNNIRQNGGVYFLTKVFIHLTFVDVNSSKASFDSIFSGIQGIVKKAERIDKKMGTYLLNSSPAVTNQQGVQYSTLLTSEESLTNLMPYRSQGLIATQGTRLGTDVRKKAPFYLDTHATSEGSSVLVMGTAGSGKTVFSYHYSLQAMATETSTIYLDLKGGTVNNALGKLMDNYITLDFSGKNAKFINPMILSKVNKEYSVKDATETTAVWLALMVDLAPGEGHPTDLDRLLKSAIKGYYTELGVTDSNTDTYSKTSVMELGKLVSHLGSNRQQSTSEDEIRIYEIAIKRISALLYEHNMNLNTNAIDVTSLYDYDAIIFDFNKDQSNTIDRIDVIRIFSVMFFTKQMSSFNKRLQRYTMLFADEGNQYLGIKGLASYISDVTARARSSNASVVFITNSLSVVQHEELSGFRSNIAVYIVGKSNDAELSLLTELNNSPLLYSNAKRIGKYPGNYKHSFAVHSTLNGYNVDAIVRADIPPEVEEAFRSRTVK